MGRWDPKYEEAVSTRSKELWVLRRKQLQELEMFTSGKVSLQLLKPREIRELLTSSTQAHFQLLTQSFLCSLPTQPATDPKEKAAFQLQHWFPLSKCREVSRTLRFFLTLFEKVSPSVLNLYLSLCDSASSKALISSISYGI